MDRIPTDNIKRILFIRRDNIGDLICTTPTLSALRKRFPEARLDLFVNSYNAEVMAGNPEINDLHIYRKAKHYPERFRLGVWAENLMLMARIRAQGYDLSIAGGLYSRHAERYSMLAGARIRIGYRRDGKPSMGYNHPLPEPTGMRHEVLRTFDLIRPLGIEAEPGRMTLVPDPAEVDKCKASLKDIKRPLVALAISARMPINTWPIEKFEALIEKTIASGMADVMLLWSPGSPEDKRFPGDDHKAERLIRKFGSSIAAYRTHTVSGLIAALSLADYAVTLDTGSLHIAAALGKPSVNLITTEKVSVWGPWMCAHKALHAEDVSKGIEVEEVYGALRQVVGGGVI